MVYKAFKGCELKAKYKRADLNSDIVTKTKSIVVGVTRTQYRPQTQFWFVWMKVCEIVTELKPGRRKRHVLFICLLN